MTQFITLMGKKQTGKDSSAKIVRQYLTSNTFTFGLDAEGEINLTSSIGYGPLGEFGHTKVHITHFSDALKKACNIIFGIPLEDMETEEGKQKLTHIRWPTAIMDDDDPNKTYANVDDFDVSGYVPSSTGEFMTVREVLQFVGTDLFRNQMDPDIWLESVFRQPWEEDDIVIIADARFPNEVEAARKHGTLIQIQRDTGLKSDGHKSETALDEYSDYHYSVDNNGTVDELVGQLNAILLVEKTVV